MSLIIPVVHPSPVLYALRRARTLSLGYLRRETTVEIPEADASGFVPVAVDPSTAATDRTARGHGTVFHERAGRLWQPLRDRTVPPGTGSGRLSREAFAARLSEGLSDSWTSLPAANVGARRPDDMVLHFTRTPLLANRLAIDIHKPRSATGVGELEDVEGVRVVADLSAEADAGLRAFLREEVAVVGDDVLVRLPGPMAVQPAYEGPDFRTSFFPRARHLQWTTCRPDEIGALRELQSRHGFLKWSRGLRKGDLLDPGALDGLPPDLMGDDDLALNAAGLTRTLEVELRGFRGREPGDRDLAEMHGRMARASALAALGIMAAGSVEAQFRQCLDAMDMVSGRFRSATPLGPLARDYVESFALPRLRRDAPVDDADAEALAGVGPGF